MLPALLDLFETVDEHDFKSAFRDLRLANLGKGLGDGTLKAPNAGSRMVWIRYSDTHELDVAYLPPGMIAPYRDGDPRVETQGVRVGKAPGSELVQVIDAVALDGRSSTGDNSLMEEVIYEALFARLKNFLQLRASSTGSNNIQVEGPYPYRKPSTGDLTLFLTGFVSAQTAITALTAGQHQLGIVYLNEETNALGLATGTAVTATYTLPSRSEFAFSDVQAVDLELFWKPIIPVYLYYNQSSVVETDFYRDWDLRPMFTSGVGSMVISNVMAVLQYQVQQVVQVVSHHISHIADVLQTQVLDLDPMMTSDPLAVEIFS